MPYKYKVIMDFAEELENEDSPLKREGLVQDSFLVFKPVDFPNPITQGDEVRMGVYSLGIVQEVQHYLSDQYTDLYVISVTPGKADTHALLSKYKERQSGLEDKIEGWIG